MVMPDPLLVVGSYRNIEIISDSFAEDLALPANFQPRSLRVSSESIEICLVMNSDPCSIGESGSKLLQKAPSF